MVKYTWFPGHMAKALRDIESKLKHVDLILEVRDARVPLSSVNDRLGKALANKRRIVVLNKTDLADPSYQQVRFLAAGSVLCRMHSRLPWIRVLAFASLMSVGLLIVLTQMLVAVTALWPTISLAIGLGNTKSSK